ncbi:MAG: hypothetical protein JWR36_1857 [Glaciihabitans sp.]|nr:hypothetical protein [Glaciihabitans sp.]MDQ1571709.1 mannan endo,4-beta-mannosidase [Actinomycetota bacterium]
MSSITGVWWAHTPRKARRTAVAAIAIGVALLLVSAFVWYSPANPVGPIHISAAVARAEALAKQKALQQRQLLSSVSALKQKLALAESRAATAQQALDKATNRATESQRQLTALKRSAAAAAAASAAAQHSSSITTSSPLSVASTPVSTPSLSSIVHPATRLFGMYTAQAPFNFATFDDTSAKIGSSPNVVGYFGGWDQTYRADAVKAAWKRHTLPILTWESRPIDAGNNTVSEPEYTVPKILSGKYDTYLRQYARAIVKAKLPLGIRFDHEMNGVWYPWSETDGQGNSINSNSPGDYVKMWKYVHDIFQSEGANKYVFWIWSPNIINNLPTTHKSLDYLKSLYPGDAYVDWVGLSGYLRPAYKPDNDFSFNYTFGSSIDQLRQLTSKPIFLSEIGASEVGGHKSAWITSLFDALAKPENADILGFSWFDMAVTSYTEGQLATNDWRIDSRPDSLAAFKAGINTPGDGFKLRRAS